MRGLFILASLVVIGVVLVGVMAVQREADAAFPGGNGLIVYAGVGPAWDWEVFTVDPTTGDVVQVTVNPGKTDESPEWSPDGTKIAFHGGSGTIFMMNADGSGRTEVTGKIQASAPVWSPDGSQIAFQREQGGALDIFVVNTDGSGLAQLTKNAEWNGHPSWSPDGSKIVFASDRGPAGWNIWVMNADGSDQTQLTTHPAYEDAPDWSPDGSQIVFRRDHDVWAMNADGSGDFALTSDPAFDGMPAWSPDGSQVAFVSYRAGNHEIFRMDADGSNQTQLTFDSDSDFEPDWQPVVACAPDCPTPLPEPTETEEPKPTPTDDPKDTPTPTPTKPEPTDTPTKEPTPTPGPGSDPVMSLTVKGGECDDPKAPTTCDVYYDDEFLLSVNLHPAPEGGYILMQTMLDIGASLTYQATEDPLDEIVWPDVAKATAVRATKGPGVVAHGGITALKPPLPVSKHTGPLVQVTLTCSGGASASEVTLLPFETKETTPDATMLLAPDIVTRIVPAISPLTINCVEPPPDSDNDGCSDDKESGGDPILGGMRDYLNPHDFFDPNGDARVDLPNDILGVIQRYSANPVMPYDPFYDRGTVIGEPPWTNPWNRNGPDGTIDMPNDILGVVMQWQHDCR